MGSFLKPTDLKFTIIAMVYGAMLCIAPILSNRIVTIFDMKILVGTIVAIIAMGLLDVLNNDYGLKKARSVIVGALVARLVLWGVISLIMFLPVAQETPNYEKMVRVGFQMLLAGEAAIFISQYFVDSRLFDWLKSRTNYFIVRYLATNLISYTLSLAIFLPIALYGRYDTVNMVALFTGQLVGRLAIQFFLAPIYSALTYNKTKTEVA